MPGTISIEVPVEQEQLVRRFLALTEELDRLALSAPDGTVFDACESAVIAGGREVQTRMLEQAVARRIEATEKRGPRSAPASAVGSRRTAASRRVNS